MDKAASIIGTVTQGRTLGAATLLLAFLAHGGCPVLAPPFDIDGTWLLDYSNSPNPNCLTFTDRRITSELAGCVEPVEILSATQATIDGTSVHFSYRTRQTLLVAERLLSAEGLLIFDGTVQDDGTIAGTMRAVGVLNGIPFDNSLGFIMERL